MSAWPMMPTLFAWEMRRVERAAEHEQMLARMDAGHEFAALMEPGGSVLLVGEWREVAAVEGVSDDRVTIRCADGSEWLAKRTATRRYRSAVSVFVGQLVGGSEKADQ